MKLTAKRKDDAVQNIILLSAEFPNCFSLMNPQPVKTGIFDDILAVWGDKPRLSRQKLRQALRFYMNSQSYLKSYRAHTMRINLKGERVEELEPEHVTYAKEQFVSLYLKDKKKVYNSRDEKSAQDSKPSSSNASPSAE